MNSDIYVSLDIGTSSIKVIIGEMVNGSLNIIGVGNAKSEGLRRLSRGDIYKAVHHKKSASEYAKRMRRVNIRRERRGLRHTHVSIAPSQWGGPVPRK